MREKLLQAKDITEEQFLGAVHKANEQTSVVFGWPIDTAMVWDLARILDVPEKIVRAKAARLIKKGVLEGCTCGCRGDFRIVRP